MTTTSTEPQATVQTPTADELTVAALLAHIEEKFERTHPREFEQLFANTQQGRRTGADSAGGLL